MDRRDLLLGLAQDLLAAPGHDDRWRVFLDHLCDAVKGSAISFIAHKFGPDVTVITRTSRTPPEALEAYGREWYKADPWARSPRAHALRAGHVVIGDALIDRAALERTAFFNEFGRQCGVVHCLAGMIDVSPQGMSCLSINGDIRRSPFDVADASLLDDLMPAIQNALHLDRRLTGVDLLAAAFADALDGLRHGVVLLGPRAEVLWMNRAAAEVLRRKDGLSLQRNELRAATPGASARLHQAIADAALAQRGERMAPLPVPVPRPSGRPPFAVAVSPLPFGMEAITTKAPTMVVTITWAEERPMLPLPELRALLGLTVREAELVQLLVAGDSLTDAARRLSMQPVSARTLLKLVFQKTGTHRQAELVRLALTLVPSARVVPRGRV